MPRRDPLRAQLAANHRLQGCAAEHFDPDPEGVVHHRALLELPDPHDDQRVHTASEPEVLALGQDIPNHSPVDVREAKIAPRVAKRQFFMIHPQQMQDRS